MQRENNFHVFKYSHSNNSFLIRGPYSSPRCLLKTRVLESRLVAMHKVFTGREKNGTLNETRTKARRAWERREREREKERWNKRETEEDGRREEKYGGSQGSTFPRPWASFDVYLTLMGFASVAH